MLDKARAEGLQITQDQYAYTAMNAGFGQFIPSTAQEGGPDSLRLRAADPEQRADILSSMHEIRENLGYKNYEHVVISRHAKDPGLLGKNVSEAAALRRASDSLADQTELILDMELQGGAKAVCHTMNEDDLRVFMRHPLTMTASDGGLRQLGVEMPHPRSYGNNARVLGLYVRDLGVLELEEAVRRMTSLPAEVFRLKDRGVIREGAVADLAIFDPAVVADKSAFDDPHHYAVGFSEVLVNGMLVIEAGKLTDARPGRAVRMSQSPH